MPSPDPYVGLAVHVAACLGLGVGLLVVAALIRYRVTGGGPDKLETYECGELPIGSAWRQTPVGFYLVALLFILFDAEVAFLFLWVEGLRQVGPQAFWAMVVFVGVLLLGWAYAWRKGDLTWTR